MELNRPLFTDRQGYSLRFTDAGYWRPYIQTICVRHGLGACSTLRSGLPGTNPVFIVDDRYVVKLYTDLFGGAVSYLTERNVYALIARYPEIPAPALVATGRLFDADDGWPWPYLVICRIPGCSLGESAPTVADRQQVVAWLGPAVRRLHTLPLAGCDSLRPTWDTFASFLVSQRAQAAANHARWGTLPAHLVAQIEAYLPDAETLIDCSRPPLLLHGDLNRDHVLGECIGGVWQPSGIIDFGDARVGDFFYELPALHLGLFESDPRLLGVFLTAYGLEASWGEDFVRRAMTMTLLHEFNVLCEIFEQRPEAIAAATLEEFGQLLWNIETL